MKHLAYLLIIVTGFSLSFSPNPAALYSLEEAIQKGLVEVSISGVEALTEDELASISMSESTGSSYYGKCIALSILNNSGKNLKLKLENGRMLTSDIESVQDMVVTKEELITLSPSQSEEYNIYAMCSEMSDQAPSSLNNFSLGLMAEEDLRGMTALVEKFNVQNSSGQSAVWVITDDLYLEDLYFDDPEAEKAIREYAVSVVGEQQPDPLPLEEIYEEEPAPAVVRELSGSFDFSLETRSMVTLILYDPSGSEAQEFYKGQTMDGADYNVGFSAGSVHLQPGTYVMKLWVDRQLVKTQEYVVE